MLKSKKIDYPLVSILIPNFNGGKEPIECLESIQGLDYPKLKIEVIVIDNGSTDGSPKQIKQRFRKVRLIKNQQNLGFAQAINMGEESSRGELIFIGNDDLIFTPASLKTLVHYIRSNRQVGLVGGEIYAKLKPNQLLSAGFRMNRWTGDVVPRRRIEGTAEVDWVQGCAMLIPKRIFKMIGRLDNGFAKAYFEDVDLAWRVRQAGWKVVFVPGAKFLHGESITSNKNLSAKYFQWYKNKLRFVLKHGSWLNIVSIFCTQILIIMPYRGLFLHDKRMAPFVQGLVWNIQHLNQTLALRQKGPSR